MNSANAEPTLLNLSTSDLPERDRLPWWREVVGRKVVQADIEPLREGRFEANATLLEWPGLRAIWAGVSTPTCWHRSRGLLGDGDDCFSLIVGGDLTITVKQGSNEVPIINGDAVGVLNAESGSTTLPECGGTALIVPREALTPLVRDVDQKAMRLIPRDNEALRLLVKYSSNLREEPEQMSAELRHLAVTHIHGLMAVALGATRDGVEMASARGMRAARLEATKADILENLTSPDLAVGEVARRQGVTPRYIHMLFESEGVTFTEFVCEARLRRAHSMLVEPRYRDRSIMTIAFAVGFGDVSYFNRCFRRRFGAAPSELRGNGGRVSKNKGQDNVHNESIP